MVKSIEPGSPLHVTPDSSSAERRLSGHSLEDGHDLSKAFVPNPPAIPKAGWFFSFWIPEKQTKAMEEIHQLASGIATAEPADKNKLLDEYSERLADLMKDPDLNHRLSKLLEIEWGELIQAGRPPRILTTPIIRQDSSDGSQGPSSSGSVETPPVTPSATSPESPRSSASEKMGVFTLASPGTSQVTSDDESRNSGSSSRGWSTLKRYVSGSTRSSEGKLAEVVTQTIEIAKTGRDYRTSLEEIRAISDRTNTASSVRQKEVIEGLPGYLTGKVSWEPWTAPAEGVWGAVSRYNPFSNKTEQPPYVDEHLLEARKFGAELLSNTVDIEVLKNLASNKKKFDTELARLKKSQTIIEQYLEKLRLSKAAVNLTDRLDKVSISQQIEDEIIRGTVQKKQIEDYLRNEAQEAVISERIIDRKKNDYEVLKDSIETAIKRRVKQLQRAALTLSDSRGRSITEFTNEALFHRAVSEIYEHCAEGKDAQSFIVNFARAVEELTLERGFSKQTPEKAQKVESSWDNEEYGPKVDDRIRKDILKEKEALDKLAEKTSREIESLEETLPQIEERQKVDSDILKALENKLAQQRGELEIKLIELAREQVALQEHYRLRLAESEVLSSEQNEIKQLLDQESPGATDLLTLIEKLEIKTGEEEKALYAGVSKLKEAAEKIIFMEQQVKYLKDLSTKHLETRENKYREIYQKKHAQLELEVETNNLRTRWLALQRSKIREQIKSLEAQQKNLDLSRQENNRKKIAEFKEKIRLINAEQDKLNALYGKSLREMQIQANKENKRRKETYENSGEQPTLIRNLLKKIYDSDKVEVDFQSIELRRQLAYNGIKEIGKAVWETVTTTAKALMSVRESARIDPKNLPQNLKDFAGLIGKLDDWILAHPLEAQRFAGNLQHAYGALQNKGFMETGFRRGNIENILKDLATGSKKHIAADDAAYGMIDVMPPEVIALLYMADWFPEITRAGGALTGNGLAGVIAYGAATLVAAPMLIAGVAAAALGYAQACAERTLAKAVTEHRDVEVAVSAFVDGLKQGGTLKDAAKAVAKTMIVREALQVRGDLVANARLVGKLGAVRAMIGSFRDWWNLPETSTTEKAVFIGTQVILPALATGAFIAGSILTGGALPLVTAIGYGIAVGVGAFLASAVGHRLKYKLFDRTKQEKVRELETNRRMEIAGIKLDAKLDESKVVLENLKKLHRVSDEEIEQVRRGAKDEILAHTLASVQSNRYDPVEKLNTGFTAQLVQGAQLSPAGVSLDEKDKEYWEAEAKRFQTEMEKSLKGEDSDFVIVESASAS